MKILYLTTEYKNRRLRYGNELKKLGHKVTTINIRKESFNVKDIVKPESYDILFIRCAKHIGTAIPIEFIKYIRDKGVKVVCYGSIQTSVPILEWSSNIKYIDISFIMNKEIVKIVRDLGHEAYYLPLGYYKDQYYPINTDTKEFPVTFLGHLQFQVPKELDRRAEVINYLVNHNIDISIWCSKTDRINIETQRYSTHRKQNRIYNKSKINLDLPWINSTLPDYANMVHMKNRFMEIPGSKGFLLTKRCDEFEDIFQDGIHCAYYDSNEELIDKIRYYLSNDEVLERIAYNGYKLVKSKYQFKHIFSRMIDILKNTI